MTFKEQEKELKMAASKGDIIAQILQLKEHPDHPGSYRTTWGPKTNIGLYFAIRGIIESHLSVEVE